MSFLEPAALHWLWLALPIVALYLLRLRRRPVEVPSLLLWRRMGRQHHTSALWRRLRQWLSLLIHLLVLGGLVGAMARPYLAGRDAGPRTFVMVLDVSASMRASRRGRTRFEAAKAAVARRIRALGVGDRAMLIAAARTPRVACPLTDRQGALLEALDALKPQSCAGGLGAAIRLGAGIAAAHPGGRLLLFSDGDGLSVSVTTVAGQRLDGRLIARDAEGVTLRAADGVRHRLAAARVARLASAELARLPAGESEYLRVGAAQENLAITRFRIRRLYGSTEDHQVMVRVDSTARSPRSVTLSLLLDGRLVDSERLRIGPGATRTLLRPMVFGTGRLLQARLEPSDDFPLDDVAWCVLPARQPMRILYVHAGEQTNQFLLAALTQRPEAEVHAVEIGGHRPDQRQALTIFDRCTPTVPLERLPPGGYLYIRPLGPHPPFPVVAQLTDPWVREWRREDPLLRFCRFEELRLRQATEYELPTWMRPLMAELGGAALMAYGERRDRRVLLWSFDPLDSLLVVRPSFPNLVANLVDFFRRGGRQATRVHQSYRAGDQALLRPPAAVRRLTVSAPDGRSRVQAVSRHPVAIALSEVGLYQVRGPGFSQTLAVNLESPRESDLQPAVGLGLGERAGSLEQPVPTPARELWPLLLLIALVLLLAEWALYTRISFF